MKFSGFRCEFLERNSVSLFSKFIWSSTSSWWEFNGPRSPMPPKTPQVIWPNTCGMIKHKHNPGFALLQLPGNGALGRWAPWIPIIFSHFPKLLNLQNMIWFLWPIGLSCWITHLTSDTWDTVRRNMTKVGDSCKCQAFDQICEPSTAANMNTWCVAESINTLY